MATKPPPSNLLSPQEQPPPTAAAAAAAAEVEEEEEEFIDMDVSSSTFFYYTITSPPLPNDFEFHLSFTQPDKGTSNASPADELFYKGKLLPLHLPPRLQMLEKLLCEHQEAEDDDREVAGDIPFGSCSLSSASSAGASGKSSPEDCRCEAELVQCSTAKKRWKLAKEHYSIGRRLKASRAFLKSLFSKSQVLFRRIGGGASTGGGGGGEGAMEENSQRRSVSGAIFRYLPAKKDAPPPPPPSSSSFFCEECSSGDGARLSLLVRSGRVESEESSSIQRAIAYCNSSYRSTAAGAGDRRCSRFDALTKDQHDLCSF